MTASESADADRENGNTPGMSRPSAFLLLLACAAFAAFSEQRLVHTDLWGHLAYGREITLNRKLPDTEPFMPLAAGVPFRDTAWLSKVSSVASIRWREESMLCT